MIEIVAHESNCGLVGMFYLMVDSILRKLQIKLYVAKSWTLRIEMSEIP